MHAVGHFERRDAGVELVVAPRSARCARFIALQQIELPPLLAAGKVFVPHVLDDLCGSIDELSMCVPWYTPGRKLLLHSCGPTTGLPGQSTMKPGRFWFSEPSA